MNKDEPILITGCARSGTSVVAGIFYFSGAWGGEMRGPTEYNKKGMFENKAIVEKLVKPFLQNIGCDPLGQNPLPDTDNLPIPVFWNQAIENILEKEGYNDEIWFYKGAKMCLLWPIWHIAYPKAKWIIVRRPDQDIINSCLRTPFMRAYRNVEGWQKWVDHHKRCFEEMRDAKLDITEIRSDLLVGGNFDQIRRAVEYCGLRFDEQAVKAFVDPTLYHRS